jgi:hypothetical protein
MRLLTHEDGYLLVTLSVEDKMDPELNKFVKDAELYHVQVCFSRVSFFFFLFPPFFRFLFHFLHIYS